MGLRLPNAPLWSATRCVFASCPRPSELDANGHHFASCCGHANARTFRHDSFVRALHGVFAAVGVSSAKEVPGVYGADLRRADIFAPRGFSDDTFAPAAFDVCIADPTVASHVTAAANTSLATACSAERRKTSLYGADATRRGLRFYPFCVESTGGFGPSAVRVINSLATAAAARRGLDETLTKQFLGRRLSVALAKAMAGFLFETSYRQMSGQCGTSRNATDASASAADLAAQLDDAGAGALAWCRAASRWHRQWLVSVCGTRWRLNLPHLELRVRGSQVSNLRVVTVTIFFLSSLFVNGLTVLAFPLRILVHLYIISIALE